MTVRPWEPRDAEALRRIFNAIVGNGEAFVQDHALSPAEWAAYMGSYTAAFVADDDGRVVGGYLLRPNQPGRGSHVANGTYVVDPAIQGRGLGRTLGEHSLAQARAMGFKAIQFNAVVATNRPAVSLWERLGFRVIGTVPGGFRRGDGTFADLLILHRTL